MEDKKYSDRISPYVFAWADFWFSFLRNAALVGVLVFGAWTNEIVFFTIPIWIVTVVSFISLTGWIATKADEFFTWWGLLNPQSPSYKGWFSLLIFLVVAVVGAVVTGFALGAFAFMTRT